MPAQLLNPETELPEPRYKLNRNAILRRSPMHRNCNTMANVIQGKPGESKAEFGSSIVKKFNDSVWGEKFRSANTTVTDETAGITDLLATVLEAPYRNAIGRMIVHTHDTMRESVKIRLTKKAKAVHTTRTKMSVSVGERNDFIEIVPNLEIEASDEWDRNQIEDADWDLVAQQSQGVAKGLAELETEVILAKLKDLAAGDLAGNGDVAASGADFNWADMVNLWTALQKEEYNGDVMVLHPDQYGDLLKDSDFKDQTILGQYMNPANGMFGSTILGCQILVTNLQTAGHVYMLDSMECLQYVLRRDSLLVPYERPPNDAGLQMSTRYGLEFGRKNAFARMVDA